MPQLKVLDYNLVIGKTMENLSAVCVILKQQIGNNLSNTRVYACFDIVAGSGSLEIPVKYVENCWAGSLFSIHIFDKAGALEYKTSLLIPDKSMIFDLGVIQFSPPESCLRSCYLRVLAVMLEIDWAQTILWILLIVPLTYCAFWIGDRYWDLMVMSSAAKRSRGVSMMHQSPSSSLSTTSSLVVVTPPAAAAAAGITAGGILSVERNKKKDMGEKDRESGRGYHLIAEGGAAAAAEKLGYSNQKDASSVQSEATSTTLSRSSSSSSSSKNSGDLLDNLLDENSFLPLITQNKSGKRRQQLDKSCCPSS